MEHELIIKRAQIFLSLHGRRRRRKRRISGDLEYTLKMYVHIKKNVSSAYYYQVLRVTEEVFNPHDVLSCRKVSLFSSPGYTMIDLATTHTLYPCQVGLQTTHLLCLSPNLILCQRLLPPETPGFFLYSYPNCPHYCTVHLKFTMSIYLTCPL